MTANMFENIYCDTSDHYGMMQNFTIHALQLSHSMVKRVLPLQTDHEATFSVYVCSDDVSLISDSQFSW